MNKVKELIGMSPLHKLSIDIKARWDLSKFSDVNDQIMGYSTTYCISPYKTGTRYLTGCYRNEVSAHEPMHFLSLRELDKNFDEFFIKRLNTLNLKLECSGFFSAYIDEIAANPLAKDLNYIIILRSPSSWITSAVNYWDYLGKTGLQYRYPNLLFWMNKVGVNLELLLSASEKDKIKGLEKLADFYMNFTQKTQQLNNVHYVKIDEIDSFLPVLDKLIKETSHPEESQTHIRRKTFHYKNEELDGEYNKLVLKLTKN